MEFLTFEDETGLVEATFFPAVYKRYAHLLASATPYLLKGLVEEDYGAVTLTVAGVSVVKTARRADSA
jgi:DNA polymerase-3 subunit alpha/error-prone DNA polymerase